MHSRFLRFFRRGLIAVGLTVTVASFGAETPPPPASPLNSLVRKLAEKRAAQATPTPPTKEQLLKPEFRFRPAPSWLLLPDLAKQLTTNEAEREAIFALLDQGVKEARKLLAAEGAESDVAAATALFITELWKVVRQQELPEAHTDALHAQIVGALAGPDVAKMSNADKQKFWEFCIGFPVFVLGMKEVATEPDAQKDLRRIAGAAFESLIGVNPELVDIGARGLVVRAGLEEAAKQLSEPPPPTVVRAPPAVPAGDPTAVAAGVSGITYTPPAGWAQEKAAWATIYRATLFDTNDKGEPETNRDARHAGSIFVLPPRPITKDAHTTFNAVWREQLDTFDLGDTTVHYRARLKSGLVIHYMGRFFRRKNAPEGQMQDYAVVYLVDLGGGRVQPITAVAVPNDPGLGMSSFKETAAFRSLSWPLARLLDSIQPVGGRAPYPAGGFFAAADIMGNWAESSSAFGGFYVNSVTGAGAGAAVHSSAGTFRLGTDGTYDYAFFYSTMNPQFGNSSGSTNHKGRYRLDGDIVLVEPSKPISYKFTCCAVGIGTRQTSEGLKRVLVTVSARNDGVYLSPSLVPNWDSYAGTLNWYVEK
ncbi:DUF6683 family protein [Horticoccus sp. 23ND18S-11]|uniref:DUF6683 family protein n=1 Tax=Horticoccus sp. 23ND18S-11 TaxID=3391832 RepID=UPI0039C8C590